MKALVNFIFYAIREHSLYYLGWGLAARLGEEVK